ncbi:DUF4331 family protein [Flagellimonas zhangzhouensis]|uniref:DUF4331 domain-containing protein n=1 Tax=Flagellimonas zhangzhouensis TaxID=1073328 RepID=A0A1H2RLH9_9FLAO|nr:DUF4331 family protein [Allomuricauda zhangzhouensis]SDQ65117.1 protein of unknown function [Allomuricauda zhangzhouensis]SDW20098.1 protein of unknown function [Allomuricauda zhangzhouensis]
MKLRQSIYFTALILAFGLAVSCSDDDNGTMSYMDDDMMSDDMMDDDMSVDFTGTFMQVDHLGRPGINTTLSVDMEGEASIKDAHNTTIPSEMVATFQTGFQARLEQYHDVYALKLGLDPADVNYENNILGLDAATLTTVLAADVLEVAPDVPTTYFNPGTDFDNDGRILVPDGDEVALTGRHPNDDIIDVSLILFFGGMEGTRFSGQDLDDDGMADLPRLTSDGVAVTADISAMFPYLGAPE